MFDTFCPHCGEQRKHDPNGKIVYLRAYECGSFGHLGDVKNFTQSHECMKRQIKLLQTRLEREQNTVETLRELVRKISRELNEVRRRYRAFQEMF